MLSWTKKIKAIFLKYRKKRTSNKSVIKPNILEQCKILYRCFDFENKTVTQLNRVEIQFSTYFKSIEKYTLFIYSLIETINDERLIDRSILPMDTFNIYLHTFLLSEDEYYLNEKQALINFKTATLELVSILSQPTFETNIVFTTNERLCTNIIKNLTEIGYKLEPEFSPLSM